MLNYTLTLLVYSSCSESPAANCGGFGTEAFESMRNHEQSRKIGSCGGCGTALKHPTREVLWALIKRANVIKLI